MFEPLVILSVNGGIQILLYLLLLVCIYFGTKVITSCILNRYSGYLEFYSGGIRIIAWLPIIAICAFLILFKPSDMVGNQNTNQAEQQTLYKRPVQQNHVSSQEKQWESNVPLHDYIKRFELPQIAENGAYDVTKKTEEDVPRLYRWISKYSVYG